MADSPFPKLSEEQLALLRAIYGGLRQSGNWPTFAYVDKVLDREGLEVDQVASTLPRGLTNVSVRALNPSEEATLTVVGLSFVPEAKPDTDLFLGVLKLAIKAEQDYEPAAGKSEGPTITSEELIAKFGVTQNDVLRLRLISMYEPWIGSSGLSAEGRWEFHVSREVRSYRNVHSIEQYIELRLKAYQQAFGVVPPSVHLPPGRPSWTPEPSRLYPEPQQPDLAGAAKQVFVIMPFAKRLNPVYKVIKDSCESIDVRCKRSDEIEEVGKITEQIYEALQGADAIVADITGRNPNVMYELGYAHALKKAVILLNSGGTAPFDVADYRQIRYRMDDLVAARASLVQFLRHALRLEGKD